MSKNKRGGQSRQLRIIGGEWGSRRFSFPDATGIRPTSDKMRETLFNWLQFDIRDAVCLDLFAGSGALGLEALSRGAAQAHFIENHRKTADAIQAHLDTLQCPQGQVHSCTAQAFLKNNHLTFDIVFIDPPFNTTLLQDILPLALTNDNTHKDSLFFIETEQKDFPFPEQLTVLKSSQSGQSHSWLACKK